ncbi:MAG TPA: hypothetical protein PK413_13505, partial [Thermoanaerobaculia bacterium]|nr:hypothetical protein [Thermoanaerobaculia bacterium]
SGLVSPFAFSSRISPCTATNYHYGVGGVFKSGSQYFLTADRANWPDANVFYEILLGSSPDGASWSWAPFVKSTGVSSILDVTLVSSTVSVFYCDPTCNAHTAWWGFFRTGPCANCADWVGRMKVDYSTAYPRGFRVWILSGGIYKQVNDTTGEFNFAPDNVWPETDAGYAPNALVPTASGGYELWATKSPAAGGCGCSFQGGSTLVYRTATDTTLGPLQGVYSAARCMPSASSVGRLFPFVITGPTGQRLLYTSNNDKNCSNLASNPYQGMYIVATQLQ